MTDTNSTEPRRRQQEAIADTFQVPLHLIDTRQPVEHCGAQFPAFEGQPPTECVLRPGHQGSHANECDTRWIVKADAGYCPHCGRGDAGPTAEAYEEMRQRARKDAAASRESERQLQQQIDQQAKEIDRLRDELAALHEGEEEPTSIRLSGHTVATWLWSWNRATPAQRLERAALIIDAGQRAGTCFQMAHERTIQRLRADQAAVARVRALADELESAPAYGGLADGYEHAAHRIRATLESPKETPNA